MEERTHSNPGSEERSRNARPARLRPMKSRRLGIRARIVAGFLVVLVLMTSLAAVGLNCISAISAQLRDIVENNNVKIELATAMQTALRERALSMHALSVLTDPFDKDAEVQRFSALGSDYVAARQHLEQMPLSAWRRLMPGMCSRHSAATTSRDIT